MEYIGAPVSGAAYTKGNGSLYEFDCGERSDWMYRANGDWSGISCSAYAPPDGGAVERAYTCDPGGGVGGGRPAARRE